MQMVNAALISIGICGAAMLTAQEPSSPAVANAIDQEILKLRDLPGDVRARAIKDLAFRIRLEPERYAVALASNLVIDGIEGCGRDTLQEVATTLADALRRSPPQDPQRPARRILAELARYYHMEVSLDDPRYTAAISKLQADDQHLQRFRLYSHRRSGTEMELEEPARQGGAGQLLGHLVPPCRREIPDLDELYKRFRDQGLVILAITGEEASIVRPFISQQIVSYPVLLDPARKVKELFLVDGIPESFVYDREGRLVAQAIDRPAMQGFLNMLRQAGLQ